MVEILSRIQFASTAIFHFLYVPLTLGLSGLLAFMETKYAVSGDVKWLNMTKYWSRLFIINFAIGIVTGITMEFQFGMNWARYSSFVGDIFGAPLAIEATTSFFLESTFLGLWIFSWKKVNKGTHAFFMWMVAFASCLSAVWILLANGWMQNPVGFEIRNGRAEMTNFFAVIFNSYGWLKVFHTLCAAFTLASFFLMGLSAIRLLKNKDSPMFRTSFKVGAIVGLVSSIMVIIAGDFSAKQVGKYQPEKFAAMESVWESETSAPFYLLQIPDPKNETNAIQALPIPGLLSWLAYGDTKAEVKGLKTYAPEDRPPVWINFFSFRFMVFLGFALLAISLLAFILLRKNSVFNKRWFLKLMAISTIFPYLAIEFGWILAEIGRQPWIVRGLLRTKDAYSTAISTSDVWISLIGFVVIYTLLAILNATLLVKYSKKFESEA